MQYNYYCSDRVALEGVGQGLTPRYANLTVIASERGVFNYNEWNRKRKKKSRLYAKLSLLNYQGFFDKYQDNTSLLTLHHKDFKTVLEFKKYRDRVLIMIRRKFGLKLFITFSEYQKRGALHNHIIMFGVPYIPYQDIKKALREMGCDIEQLPGREALIYCVKYGKKGLRIGFSNTFYKERLLFSPGGKIRSLVKYRRGQGVFLIDYDLTSPILVKDAQGGVIGEMSNHDFWDIQDKEFPLDNYMNSVDGSWLRLALFNNKIRRAADAQYKLERLALLK